MNRVVLTRLESSDQGTFGRLSVNGIEFFTGELPWRNNLTNESCVPCGTYKCFWTLSPRFRRKLYLVSEVEGRPGIRIHSANFCGDDSKGFHKQLNGCIALGEKIGLMDGQKAVLLSKPAIRKFESLMNGEPFYLEIKDGAS